MRKTARRLMLASTLLLSACCSPLPGSLPSMPDAGSRADMATVTPDMAKKTCPRPNPICRELPLPPDRVTEIGHFSNQPDNVVVKETTRVDGNTVTVRASFEPPVYLCARYLDKRSCWDVWQQPGNHERLENENFKFPFFGENWLLTGIRLVESYDEPPLLMAELILGKPIQEGIFNAGQTFRGNNEHTFTIDQTIPTTPAGAVMSAFDCNGDAIINPRDLFILYERPTYRITLPDGSGQFIKVNKVVAGYDRLTQWASLATLSMELVVFERNERQGPPGTNAYVAEFNPNIANGTMPRVFQGWTTKIEYAFPPANLIAISVSAPVGTPFVICDR